MIANKNCDVRWRCLILVGTVAVAMLSGCALESHDAHLDAGAIARYRPAAERVTQKMASSDLACPEVETSVVSRKDVEGAPLGPVWSDFRIEARGCGKTAQYIVQCKGPRDGSCFVNRQ